MWETTSARNFAECERRHPPPLTFSKVPCRTIQWKPIEASQLIQLTESINYKSVFIELFYGTELCWMWAEAPASKVLQYHIWNPLVTMVSANPKLILLDYSCYIKTIFYTIFLHERLCELCKKLLEESWELCWMWAEQTVCLRSLQSQRSVWVSHIHEQKLIIPTELCKHLHLKFNISYRLTSSFHFIYTLSVHE